MFHEMDLANRIRSYPNGTLFEKMYALIAETDRRAGVWVDSGSYMTRLFLNAGLPWPTVKAEVPVGGEPGCFMFRWFTETLRSLLPRIEQFGLASADELQLDTLVARMEAEAVARHTQPHGSPPSRERTGHRCPSSCGWWTEKRTRPCASQPKQLRWLCVSLWVQDIGENLQ